jgi:asparagine synthase (glutamine-hydrolysing)
MCGVCGVYSIHPADPIRLAASVRRMNAVLAHRGPDDEGIWSDAEGRASLGNRRLAIIDLSSAGHQPMADAAGRVALTYNGMIYNYQELRRELEASGYRFHGHSDTEVILALYLRDGAEMCRRLRGMFALAVWDGRARHLMLARDRLGIKPLYYAHAGGHWLFASEIRALRASQLLETRVNPPALAAFLRLGSVPGPMTAFEGVLELPPASVLLVDQAGAAIVQRYWEVPPPSAGGADDEEAAATEIRARLADAVRCHLISDVPVGVFLSGGVDSGAIVALMREAGHANIRTFSITFPGWDQDEGADAARMAARYGTDHTSYEVHGSDVARELDRIIAAMDQPTIDGLNTYYVSQITRDSGTIVALSGLGGDELFAGYSTFRRMPRLLMWQHVAARLGPARPVLAYLAGARTSSWSAKLKEGLMTEATPQAAYLTMRGLLARAEVSGLLAPGPLRDAALRCDMASALSALAPPLPADPVAATAMLELRGYMHNQLLRDTDVMSMAHSLEVRVPFLDHPVVEFVTGLPADLRRNGRPPKGLLLKALGDRLPAEAGRTKRGFTFPVGEWLAGPLRQHVEDALASGLEILDADGVRRFHARVNAGRAHWSRLWALVVLVLWLRYHTSGSV